MNELLSEFRVEQLKKNSKHFYDAKIILIEDDSEYHIHKPILAGQCKFFERLFYYDQGQKYFLGYLDKKVFDEVIKWLYSVILVLTECSKLQSSENLLHLLFPGSMQRNW